MLQYIDTQKKELCCGCRACEQICHVHAIIMKEDEEGFLYPHLNMNLCTQCGLCEKVCPISEPILVSSEIANMQVYAAMTRDVELRKKSSSGGLFSEIASVILHAEGGVYGAAFDREFRLKHVGVFSEKELDRLRGSKYLQSDTGTTFSQVRDLLRQGKSVYYTETPCQIAGLKKFLRREYENLFTSDLACHGVPSQKIFFAYKDYLEHKNVGRISSFNFRDLDGWGPAINIRLERRNKTVVVADSYYLFSPYLYAFLNGYLNRPVCYSCPYARSGRVGDITLADFWGVRRFFPSLDVKKGVSLILVNTEKGRKMLESMNNNLDLMPSCFEDAVLENWNLAHPTVRPPQRDTVYVNLDKYSFEHLAKNEFRCPHKLRIYARRFIVATLDYLHLKELICQIVRR